MAGREQPIKAPKIDQKKERDVSTSGEVTEQTGVAIDVAGAKPEEGKEKQDSELMKTLVDMCAEDPETQIEKQIMLMAVVKWMEDPESFKKEANKEEKKAFGVFLEYLKKDRESLDEKVKDPNFPEEDKKILQQLLDHLDGKIDLLAVDEAEESEEDKDKKKKKGTRVESFDSFKKRIKDMSMGALLAELFKKLKNLFGNFKSIKEDISNRAKSSEYTKADVKKIDLNYERVDEKKEYISDNRDVEYVASMLGDKFPTRPSAQTFLLSLEQTFNKKIYKKKDISSLQRGDVLFFHDDDGENKEKAALTAIVYSVDPSPPKMRYVSGSTKPQEATIEESDLYKNKWLGLIRPQVKSEGESEEKPEEKAGSEDKPDEEEPAKADKPEQPPAGEEAPKQQ